MYAVYLQKSDKPILIDATSFFITPAGMLNVSKHMELVAVFSPRGWAAIVEIDDEINAEEEE